MKNVTDYTLPEYLAPYLINDDPTGLTDKEIEAKKSSIFETIKNQSHENSND